MNDELAAARQRARERAADGVAPRWVVSQGLKSAASSFKPVWPHGTYSRYMRGGCRCETCKGWRRDRTRQEAVWSAARRARKQTG